MSTIHIVGSQGSFTHDASRGRYGDAHTYVGHTHGELVAQLLKKRIVGADCAVVPLWNSNAGVINMDQQTRTADLILGRGGWLHDLWPHQIVFRLTLNGSLTRRTEIHSVAVALQQCSRFLRQQGISSDRRFRAANSTTAAADQFTKSGAPSVGLLCGEPLLAAHGLVPTDDDVTNPNNLTVFSCHNQRPDGAPTNASTSLGSVLVRIDGTELPSEFIEYYKELVSVPRLEQLDDPLTGMPRILFILRHQESKALMLLEMGTAADGDSPWQPPDVETEIRLDEVGRIASPFAPQVSDLFAHRFDCREHCYYGCDSSYTWVCPALNISVSGYDKDLVRESAKVQLLHLKSLCDGGIKFPAPAEAMLGLYEADPGKFRLSPGSEPDTPMN